MKIYFCHSPDQGPSANSQQTEPKIGQTTYRPKIYAQTQRIHSLLLFWRNQNTFFDRLFVEGSLQHAFPSLNTFSSDSNIVLRHIFIDPPEFPLDYFIVRQVAYNQEHKPSQLDGRALPAETFQA